MPYEITEKKLNEIRDAMSFAGYTAIEVNHGPSPGHGENEIALRGDFDGKPFRFSMYFAATLGQGMVDVYLAAIIRTAGNPPPRQCAGAGGG